MNQKYLQFAGIGVAALAILISAATAYTSIQNYKNLNRDIVHVSDSGAKDSSIIRDKLKEFETIESDIRELHKQYREFHDWKMQQLRLGPNDDAAEAINTKLEQGLSALLLRARVEAIETKLGIDPPAGQ